MLLNLLRLMRPHQWVKNGFVFVGLIFSHRWSEPLLIEQVIQAAIAFSLAASCVYIGNDIADRERDRQHPKKALRPLASGAVGIHAALALSGVCLLCALALAWLTAPMVFGIILAYLLFNTAYSLGLKHIVLLDVFIISAGFMLRILAGTVGVGIAPTDWMLLCGLMLTLLLGFSKRRAELTASRHKGEKTSAQRRVLEDYDPVLLDKLIGICAATTIVSYSLYTVSVKKLMIHSLSALVFTLPFVIYGIFRYLFLLHRRAHGEDPAAEIVRDPQLLLAVLGWLIVVIWALG
ncbi:MAG: decaprenyl-phosphate phosphoribosyltransferase [Betaproteobacteria bacterium]|nr:decaprenyl-phosphate phosphoribosyltransferase [Betaproteobacteria bacterium]